jgi:hypothetical protein
VAVNAQSVQDQLICLENLARAHFNAKSYPAAIEWAKKARRHGSKSAPVQAVLVRASYSIKDYPAWSPCWKRRRSATASCRWRTCGCWRRRTG